MATDIAKNRAPAPVVQDTRLPRAYDLLDASSGRKLKLPCLSPLGMLMLLRFVQPCSKHPTGMVVAKGVTSGQLYEPFNPNLINLALVSR